MRISYYRLLLRVSCSSPANIGCCMLDMVSIMCVRYRNSRLYLCYCFKNIRYRIGGLAYICLLGRCLLFFRVFIKLLRYWYCLKVSHVPLTGTVPFLPLSRRFVQLAKLFRFSFKFPSVTI